MLSCNYWNSGVVGEHQKMPTPNGLTCVSVYLSDGERKRLDAQRRKRFRRAGRGAYCLDAVLEKLARDENEQRPAGSPACPAGRGQRPAGTKGRLKAGRSRMRDS